MRLLPLLGRGDWVGVVGVPETGFLPSLFLGLVLAFPLTLLAIFALWPLLVLWGLGQGICDLLRQSKASAGPLAPRGRLPQDPPRVRLDARRTSSREQPEPATPRPWVRTVPGSGRVATAVNGLGPVARVVGVVGPWLAFLGVAVLFLGDPAEASSLSPPLFVLVLLISLTLWLAALLVLLRLAWRVACPRQGADKRTREVPL